MEETVLHDKNLGVRLCSMLMPKTDIDMKIWSVVACDQYTSEPEYWFKVNKIVGDNPSTLHLIFPEVYLETDDSQKRIEDISKCMKNYINTGILVACNPCIILVDRETTRTKSRKGLVLAIDLEEYDYAKGSKPLIRATESTVIDRLPPRIKIRENATLELPHAMLLIDDPGKTVIEPLTKILDSFEKVYDFELMQSGGHIKGYKINAPDILDNISKALGKLANPQTFADKYGTDAEKNVLLFAVGDGNHSLASAKCHWENVKKDLSSDETKNHPARFALVEVVNVHDEGIIFEPIHRVLFAIDPDTVLKSMMQYFEELDATLVKFNSVDDMKDKLCGSTKDKDYHHIGFVENNTFGIITIKKPKYNLEVATLQSFLDDFTKKHQNAKIDYIHGEDVVTKLGSKGGNIGFYLPAMKKHDLFKTIILDGVLPRKTFSMGEAEEKRFYLECRKITKDQF